MKKFLQDWRRDSLFVFSLLMIISMFIVWIGWTDPLTTPEEWLLLTVGIAILSITHTLLLGLWRIVRTHLRSRNLP